MPCCGCARSTVAEAIKALEWAGVLTWQHRITRIRERCRDLFGHQGWRWRVIRTSNAYAFRDPKATVGRSRQLPAADAILTRHSVCDAPSPRLCAAIVCFCSIVQRRRRSPRVINSIRGFTSALTTNRMSTLRLGRQLRGDRVQLHQPSAPHFHPKTPCGASATLSSRMHATPFSVRLALVSRSFHAMVAGRLLGRAAGINAVAKTRILTVVTRTIAPSG